MHHYFEIQNFIIVRAPIVILKQIVAQNALQGIYWSARTVELVQNLLAVRIIKGMNRVVVSIRNLLKHQDEFINFH